MNKGSSRGNPEQMKVTHQSKTKTAYLAGGCFWGLQQLLRDLPGVIKTEVGYAGGANDNPTYERHPGHAETIKVTYDPDQTTLEQIWDYFFRIHDPTTKNQQGNDIGDSYRSAIFCQSPDEKHRAEEFIDIVNQSGLYDKPVVTNLEPFTRFYQAEDYHQDYLIKNPGGYTCHYLRTNQPLKS